jgi:putative hydrolase of the HAD superfamily
VFESHGGLENFDRYFDHIYDVFRSKESWRVFEDVTESGLLNQLQNNGVVLGVVSNWDSRLPEILKNTGLAPYFNFILASTVVGSAKPDAAIFKEALQRAGVSAEQACHIGDEPATDIEGAHNAGMHAILIDRKDHHNGATATKVGSFHELV